MRTIFRQKADRSDGALGWSVRIIGFRRALEVILSFVLLHSPGQALSAIIPPEQNVTLAWNRSSDTNVTGYKIYDGVASRTYTNMIDVGIATNATISNLVQGATYYFAATAYDSLGLESGFSSEISYTVPTTLPGVQLRVTPTKRVILTVTGQAGHTYDIQATQDFTTWTVIGTVTMAASGSFNFTDTNAPSFSRRFYRTRERG
jgi:hypothetical protein